jgi:phosphoglycolate phosphatase
MLQDIKTIVWDWNGTLLNDQAICLESINVLLKNRALPQLTDELYREVFGFPVQDYYTRIGFDFEKEPFEVPAHEFIAEFSERLPQCPLHLDAERALSTFKYMGLKQVILSAMEQEKLTQSVANLNIEEYFEKITGLNHDYATSKSQLGIEMLAELKIKPKEALLIGDTIHDFEVAQKLGCKCVLIAEGHQSLHRLKATGVPVFESLNQLLAEVRNYVIRELVSETQP